MQVIRHGLMSKNSIIINCEACHCLYSVDDRNDWCGEWDYNFADHDFVYTYKCKCPECGYIKYFGANSEEGISRLINPQPIFSREDWDERYKVMKE